MYKTFLMLGVFLGTALFNAINVQASDKSRQELEDVVEEGDTAQFIAQAYAHAKATVKDTTLEAISKNLRPYDHRFFPKGGNAVPTVLFFHGCSGPTQSH